MSQIAVQKYDDFETIPETLLRNVEAITDSIRQRAFDLFQRGVNSSDLQDWLEAEKDVVLSPATELVDQDKEFSARIAVPGFNAKDIQVSATPDALIIEADSTHTHDEKSGAVCFCEFSEKKLFRRIPLPASINVDKVMASLDKGILQITAPKAASKQMTAGAA